MGSPLYAHLLERAAEDVEAGGPVRQLLAPYAGEGRADALALRFMAAVHRLVLVGEEPELEAFYPSTGGIADLAAVWPAFRRVVARRSSELGELLRLPCQTNEVGRCAALMVGFLRAAAACRLPLRLLEVGASAGLSLRFDHFFYSGAGASWGDPASPVSLAGFWLDAPPHLDAPLRVAERLGCDRRPLDPSRPEDRLTLTASVWADQTDRLARLRGAFDVAQRVPAVVDQANLEDWLGPRLATRHHGEATVVLHSIVEEYLPTDARARFHALLKEAGAAATVEAPLFWIRLEPLTSARHHGLTFTSWPGGDQAVLLTCGAHGTDVRLAGRGA